MAAGSVMESATIRVLSLMIIAVYSTALVLLRRGRGMAATWAFTAGSGITVAWSALAALYATSHTTTVRIEAYASLALLGALVTFYFGHRAVNDDPVE